MTNYSSIELKVPTVVNLEITELCNVKCKHCYNPWRDESMGVFSLDLIKIKKIINQISDLKIFHVVLSGGEPLSNYEILKKSMELLNEKNISFSCNTNLILMSDEKAKELSDLGLEHCLTSIPSIDAVENDEIMQSKGSLDKIIDGIKNCIKNNIRVSANMVVTKSNKHRVFETGKMMAELGCSKFFVTRAVPPVYSEISKDNKNKDNELVLTKDEVKQSLEDAIKVKNEYGISIGSLISYPLCFLGDLEKFSDFVGRGCPSQRGHVININSNGTIHTCVHEEESYGNVFQEGIEKIYQKKMIKWRNGSMHYSGCKNCEYLDVCQSGCQMTANAVNGEPASKDPLYVGPEGVTKHFDLVTDDKIFNYIEANKNFFVPKRVRFRDDGNVYVVNPRWGNSFMLEKNIAKFLEEMQKSNEKFNLKKIGNDRKSYLANLFFKDVIDTEEKLNINKNIIGLSIDLMHLPKLQKEK